MLVVVKPVYYCEHCKRHRLTKKSIQDHEPRCIYNPARAKCGWHDKSADVPSPAALVAQLATGLDVGWLRTAVGGCPACMLAVVVQANLSVGERDVLGFTYATEVERFRKEEQQAAVGW